MSASKPAATRQRRNRTTTAATVEATPASRIDLPIPAPHAMTTRWWEIIWGSPIAAEWVDADVPGLVELAQLLDDFWKADAANRPKVHAEVRLASREFGLSPMSRRGLQWEVKRVESTRAPSPPSAPSRERDPRLRALA